MPGRTAWLLAEQLSHDNPALDGAERVLLIESEAKLRSARFHRQKLHLVLCAMRQFARELEQRGLPVDYLRERDFATAVSSHRSRWHPDEIVLLEPTSVGAARALGRLPGVRLLEKTLFLTAASEFASWAGGRDRVVMEDFYRWQRRRLGLLMDGDDPAGGRWNFDPLNRRPPPRSKRPPPPYRPREDEVDAEVRRDLDRLQLPTVGCDGPRRWPATAGQAGRALRRFLDHRLSDFGPYQDAMLHGEHDMWHSQLSSSLNLGLLDPLAVARAAEASYRRDEAPLASVEGFIRQVIGWREYVWGMYRLRYRDWQRANALGATSPLPAVFDGGTTRMRCLEDTLGALARTAYAHHIVRLMVFGNLMLLLGIRPREASHWFQQSFIDGYEWVMEPNVVGMATWADGGIMMTKPYAASGRYIDRMSDYCGQCPYEPGRRTGEDACPFTTLYWDFLDRNRERLARNHRMKMPYRNLDRLDEQERGEIRRQARALRRNFRA